MTVKVRGAPGDSDMAQAHEFLLLLAKYIAVSSVAIEATERLVTLDRQLGRWGFAAQARASAARTRAELTDLHRQVDALCRRFPNASYETAYSDAGNLAPDIDRTA